MGDKGELVSADSTGSNFFLPINGERFEALMSGGSSLRLPFDFSLIHLIHFMVHGILLGARVDLALLGILLR